MADDTNLKINYHGTKVEALERLATDPSAILGEVGIHLVSVTQKAFREQRRGTDSWTPRRIPNIPGALRDLENSPNVKARRFQGRPAVVDTAQLSKSFTWRFASKHRILFGTKVPYANIQQFGGASRIKITKMMRENLGKWLKKQRGKEKREEKKSGEKTENPMSAAFGWLFSIPVGSSAVFRVKARPFVGFYPDDRKKMNEIILRHLKKA